MTHDPHDHTPTGDDPDSPTILYFGTVGAIVVVVSILALAALNAHRESVEFAVKAEAGTTPMARELRNAQASTLARYRWLDREKGVVGLPIDRAIRLVVEERGAPRPFAAPATQAPAGPTRAPAEETP